MIKYAYAVIGLASLAGAFLLSGCSKNKLPQGKFTEEQMETIPYADQSELPQASGGLVLGIGSETITVDEVLAFVERELKPIAEQHANLATFRNQALPHIRDTLRGKVTEILLYQEAQKNSPENIDEIIEKAVESEISRFVSSYDNNYALAENAIKQMGMDWQSFREYEKKLIMTQTYISSTLKEEKRFAYRNLVDYYESIKDEQFTMPGVMEFSIIDIDPEKLTAGVDPEAHAKEILARLEAGEDFAEVAKQSSHGPFAATGGKLEPVTPGSNSLTEPYGTLAKHAQQMQSDQITGPIEIQEHLFILKLNHLQHRETKSFAEVQPLIEQQLQFLYRQEQYNKLVSKLILKADIQQLEQFAQFCTREAYFRWSGQ